MNIAIHASPTAMEFFLANFYLSSPFTFTFPKPPKVFPVLAVGSEGSWVGLQNKLGHPAHRQLMRVPVLSARGI